MILCRACTQGQNTKHHGWSSVTHLSVVVSTLSIVCISTTFKSLHNSISINFDKLLRNRCEWEKEPKFKTKKQTMPLLEEHACMPAHTQHKLGPLCQQRVQEYSKKWPEKQHHLSQEQPKPGHRQKSWKFVFILQEAFTSMLLQRRRWQKPQTTAKKSYLRGHWLICHIKLFTHHPKTWFSPYSTQPES